MPQVLGRMIWPAMVLWLVLVAMYVSGGRLLMAALPDLQEQIREELAGFLPPDFSIGSVSGRMDGFFPRFDLTDVSFAQGASAATTVQFNLASIRIDPWQSLLSGSVRFDQLLLLGPTIDIDLSRGEGEVALPKNVLGMINGFTRVLIRNAHIRLAGFGSSSAPGWMDFAVDLDLVRDRSQRQLRVAVASDKAIVLSAEGSGTGDPWEPGRFAGELHGSVDAKAFSRLASTLQLPFGAVGYLNFWLNINQGDTEMTVSAELDSVRLGSEAQQVNLDQLAFEGLLMGGQTGIQGWLQNLSLTTQAADLRLDRAYLMPQGTGWAIRTTEFPIADLSAALISSISLPQMAQDVLVALNPRGQIQGLELAVESLTAPLDSWQAAVRVKDASTDPFRAVPGLIGVDASITASDSGATAWIRTADFTLDLPRVYDNPIQLDQVLGRLIGRWQHDALFLERGLLLASAKNHDATVQFGIDIPLNRASSVSREMRLAVAVRDAPVSIRSSYIPRRLPTATYEWLETALPTGQATEVAFLWHGTLGPYGQASQTMQLAADLTQVRLEYQQQWPGISLPTAKLRLDDTRVGIWADEAVFADLGLSGVSAELQIAGGAAQLLAGAQSESPLNLLHSSLKRLPALAFLTPVLDDFSLSGQASTQALLGFDLVRIPETLDIQVSTLIGNGHLASTLLDLEVANINGRVTYDHATGFHSEALNAAVFGQPATIAMGPHWAPEASTRLAASIQVDASLEDLASWRGLSVPPAFKGDTTLAVGVSVSDTVAVTVRSSLQGIDIDLPLPWGKSAAGAAPIELQWHSADDPEWQFFWFGRLSGAFRLDDAGEPALWLDLTPRTRPKAFEGAIPERGTKVSGRIPQIDLNEWQVALEAMHWGDPTASTLLQFENVRIDDIIWRDQSLGWGSSTGVVSDGDIDMDIQTSWLTATVSHRPDAMNEFIVDWLDLSGLPELPQDWEQLDMPDPDGVLSDLVPVRITAGEVRRDGKRLGRAALTWDRSEQRGWQFFDIDAELVGITWQPGTKLSWLQQDNHQITQLMLDAQFLDIGDALEQLDIGRPMETKRGALRTHWLWPGGPMQFDLLKVEGSLDIDLASGAFLNANTGAEGALRLLSLLNLSGLFTRANVNQLFEPGVTFDRATGHFDFATGKLSIPNFAIEGSGGYFTFVSDIDLVAESIDGELVVTLPLVDNIPWVAALAGGLPVAAGTYLFSKIFEDQVNRMSSGVYSVGGTLDAPEVIFERVFDAQSKKPVGLRQTSSEESDEAESSSSEK